MNDKMISELKKALTPFAFLNVPHDFHSTDGGCTEVLIDDRDVQEARRLLADDWQRALRERPANGNGVPL